MKYLSGLFVQHMSSEAAKRQLEQSRLQEQINLNLLSQSHLPPPDSSPSKLRHIIFLVFCIMQDHLEILCCAYLCKHVYKDALSIPQFQSDGTQTQLERV